jgi:hypothetical protein
MNKLYMEYRRPHTRQNGVYTYMGKVECPDGTTESFIGIDFRGLVKILNRLLNQYEGIEEVVMQRTDSAGILPMGLGPVMIDLLKRDPLAAYRVMNFDTGAYDKPPFLRYLEVERFGPEVYIQMTGGYVECPLTGTFRPLAYGSKHGWKIRGEGASHQSWLPLVKILDSSPEGCIGFERLAFCRWAVVRVTDLLAADRPQYYLPRVWNKDGPWISKKDLERMLNTLGEMQCQA